MGNACCGVCNNNATVTKEEEFDVSETGHTKIVSNLPKEIIPKPIVLVRNVHTGISIDIRWILDNELYEAGMEGEEQLDENFIEQIMNEDFFSQYSLNNQEFSVKDQFFAQLKKQHGYPN